MNLFLNFGTFVVSVRRLWIFATRALGCLDGFWEMQLNIYDIAAGTVILRGSRRRGHGFHRRRAISGKRCCRHKHASAQ